MTRPRSGRSAAHRIPTRARQVRAARQRAPTAAEPSAAELEGSLRILATLMDGHPDLANRMENAFTFLERELSRTRSCDAMRDRAKSMSWLA